MLNVTDATFAAEVLERSRSVPVIVDLWATWCGPCTTLGPMLETAVAARGGSVELAKVDVDANPQIAQMFQVQSIPAVFAVVDTQVVDSFVGALSEREIEEFLNRIIPTQSEADQLLGVGDEASLRKALELEPANGKVIIALGALLLESNRPQEALQLFAKVPETPEVSVLVAQARLAEQEVDLKSQEMAPLLEELLERVVGDDDARQEYLDLLATLGPESELAATYRKKLAAKLF